MKAVQEIGQSFFYCVILHFQLKNAIFADHIVCGFMQ